jgi:uncharacterized membrane protein
MTWFPLAASAAAVSSLVGITDKIVVERYLRNNWSFPFLTAAFLGFYALLLLAVRGYLGLVRLPASPALIVALLPGVFQYGASLLYVRALLKTDAATVAAINQTAPLFSLMWGWLFLGDVFSPLSYAGILVIVLCCVLLSSEQSVHVSAHTVNPALFLAAAGALLRSLGDLCVKLTLARQDYWNTFGLSRALLLPISMLLLLHSGYRGLLVRSLRANDPVLVTGVAALELLVMVPMLLGTTAYARGPLALVSTVVYTTPLFVLLFTIVLNQFVPGLVPEHPRSRPVGQRFALITGVLLGIAMLHA